MCFSRASAMIAAAFAARDLDPLRYDELAQFVMAGLVARVAALELSAS